MTSRDRLHTLRSRAPDFLDAGSVYSASFVGNRLTGGHWLVGGNVNDDHFIDVLDFGSFVTRFQLFYGTGDTPCGTPFFHPDLTGDGLVFTADFTFIQIHLLEFHEPNCCGVVPLDGESWSNARRHAITKGLTFEAAGLLSRTSRSLMGERKWDEGKLGENEPPVAMLPPAEGSESDAAAFRRGPVTSITVADLWRQGQGDLAAADLNQDGILDLDDMLLFSRQYSGTLEGVSATKRAPGTTEHPVSRP